LARPIHFRGPEEFHQGERSAMKVLYLLGITVAASSSLED